MKKRKRESKRKSEEGEREREDSFNSSLSVGARDEKNCISL